MEIAVEDSFREMREHIISIYGTAEVSHSFVNDGQVFDCMPEHLQPALQGKAQGLAPLPRQSPPRPYSSAERPARLVEFDEERRDEFGNECRLLPGRFRSAGLRSMNSASLVRFETTTGKRHRGESF
jgi:hypothetical protein